MLELVKQSRAVQSLYLDKEVDTQVMQTYLVLLFLHWIHND